MPLTFASTVSADCQFRVEDCPQLMFAFDAENDPVTGAITTVALAIPAVKRGRGPFLERASPRGQGLVSSLPAFVTWMIAFSPALTVTLPDQTSLPSCVMVTW